MDTQYVHDAVAASEVFAFSPGALPLESDGIHPTFRGAQEWASTIARVLWE
jgi:lysophospholipase L1-like esterase